MSEFCWSSTHFIIFIPRLVMTGYDRLQSWSAVLGFWRFLGPVWFSVLLKKAIGPRPDWTLKHYTVVDNQSSLKKMNIVWWPKKYPENTWIGWGKLVANFHPNLKSGSQDNVYIRKVTLKFWPVHQKKSQKSQINAESLPFIRGNVLAAFPKKILVGSLTKKSFSFSSHTAFSQTDGKEEAQYHRPSKST